MPPNECLILLSFAQRLCSSMHGRGLESWVRNGGDDVAAGESLGLSVCSRLAVSEMNLNGPARKKVT